MLELGGVCHPSLVAAQDEQPDREGADGLTTRTAQISMSIRLPKLARGG